MRLRSYGIVVAMAVALVFESSVAARAAVSEVTIPLAELGYREGITAAGVEPSVTFDLPRYASLQMATLHLELHVSKAADPQSTVSVAVNGKTVFERTIGSIGNDARLVVPLEIPPIGAQLFAVTVGGVLRAAGDRCATDSSRKLFLRIGRNSALVLRTLSAGSAEAFFRDYRGTIDLIGTPDDLELVAAPYRIDRLEPWHRVNAGLVVAPLPHHRTVVLSRGAATTRRGDVLRIAPAAFAALPVPLGQVPVRRAGSVLFGALRQHLGTSTGAGDLAFDVALAGSIVGGVPQRLRVHIAVDHSALSAGTTGTLQVLVNGHLVGARMLARSAGPQTIDVAVPPSSVGPSNSVRVLVATEVPPGACGSGTSPITASLLDSSSFSWSGIERRAPSIESFLTAVNGRVVVLLTPAFARAAFHFMGELGKMNSAITQLDVLPYDGHIPEGYDYAIVFASPDRLEGLGLPLRTSAPAFAIMNPIDDVDVLRAGSDTTFALLQLGHVHGTPILALSYHGDPSGIRALELLRVGQLATQISRVTVVATDGATTYDIGDKLRVRYADDDSLARIWARSRLGIAVVLFALIVTGGWYAARRLTGRITT